jgi:tetratricopeptide (TPR) repeat protein
MKSREELIQDYIDNVLSAEDKQLFDNLYESDAEFRAELKSQEEMVDLLTHRLSSDEQTLRMSLTEAEAKYRKGKVVSWKQWLMPLAAAACILIIVKFVFFPPDITLYELPEMRSEIVRGNQNNEADRYEHAVEAFNAKDYRKSTSILLDLHQTNKTILQYQFYLGLSLIGEKKFDEAARYLSPLADGESVFQQEASYYVAIALTESGRTEEAKQRLSNIEQSSKIYDKAQKLLDKIK